MPSIYFICTGNSARSQMAEGLAKDKLGKEWEIYSGGIEAQGVRPQAIDAMNKIGIDISNQTSDVLDMTIFNSVDYVITLCGDAEETCPVVPANVTKEHWPISDPAGKDDEMFEKVRDEIGERIDQFIQKNA